MRISVIVPFLNEERYLEQCIGALVHQDFPQNQYELIFIDNGSHDRSVEIARNHPELILLEEHKPGPYAARNKGLEAARGELIAFTDADCAPSKDWLGRICEGMRRSSASIALGRRRFPHHKPGMLQMLADYEDAKIKYVLHPCGGCYVFAFTNNMTVRADVIGALGPFVEWISGADIEYVHRCLARFNRNSVVYLPDMVVTHLEIRGLDKWFGKQVIYGRSTRRVERQTPYRQLGYGERIHIYRDCVHTNHYTAWQKIGLLGALALGLCCFEMGRIWEFLEELCRLGRLSEPAT